MKDKAKHDPECEPNTITYSVRIGFARVCHPEHLTSLCCGLLHGKLFQVWGASCARALWLIEALAKLTAWQIWRQAVISACDKGGRLDKALEIYHDMETAGLEADLITFSNLVSGMHLVNAGIASMTPA